MNRTQRKDFTRLIQHSKNRFFALLAIVALGTAFFVGISAVSTIMAYSVDVYDDENHLKDITVYSNYGFDEEDLDFLRNQPNVVKVEGSRFVDVIATCGPVSSITRIHSFDPSQTINHFVLRAGRLPQKPNEVLSENGTELIQGFRIGEVVKIERPNEDLDDCFPFDEVIVVGTIDTPVYLNETKENSTLNNQYLRTYLYIPESSFINDYYTEANLLIKNGLSYNSFSDDYFDYSRTVRDEIKKVIPNQENHRRNKIYEEAMEEYEDGLQEYKDGLQEFQEKIQDAEDEIARAEKEIADGQKELNDAIQEIQKGQEELNEQKASGQKQLDEALRKLIDAENELNSGKKQLENANKELQPIQDQLDEAINQLETAQQGLQALVEAKSQLENPELVGFVTLLKNFPNSFQEMSVSDLSSYLENNPYIFSSLPIDQETFFEAFHAFLAQLQQSNPLLDENRSLKDYLDTYEGLLQEIALQEQMIANQLQSQGILVEDLDDTIEELKENKKQIQSELQSAQQQISQGEQELEKGKKSYDAGTREYRVQIANAEQTIADAWAEIHANTQKLVDARKELADGKQELEENRYDGQKELDEAKADLDKAYQDIESLEKGEWTVLDRSQHYASETYRNTVKQMKAIANIFPVFFLFVAVLVCLTTMTRMISEERGQIGIARALGYTRFQCAKKYLYYAGSATLIGIVLGSIIGIAVFPAIIYHTWRMMYVLPQFRIAIPWKLIFVTGIIFFLVMELTTWLVCQSDMKEMPSQLLRPKSPKLGKNTILERIPFLWNSLSFTNKVTARNLVRYKRRFVMTIIGVAGCGALLVTGFGIRDSINDMVDIQFYEIMDMDGYASFDEDISYAQKNRLLDSLSSRKDINAFVVGGNYNAIARDHDGKEDTVFTQVFHDGDMQKVYQLRTRKHHQPITPTNQGVIISEKFSENMNLSIGDTFLLESKNGVVREVKVDGIMEMYIYHYVLMSQSYYETTFGVPMLDNTIFIQEAGDHTKLQRDLVDMEEIQDIEFYDTTLHNFQNMVKGINAVVWVLIISSMMLAFVVLGNLTNINISERQREIATLKVLGFRRREVERYLYNENNILTILGSFAGIPIGILLHHYIMRQVEMKYIMFGRTVSLMSIAIAVVLTILFGLFVNIMMRKNLHRIEMVESLKSVE